MNSITKKEKKVEAIILGAARAGSTTLAAYLASHKNINFSKEKEVHFFAFNDLFAKGDKYINSLFQKNEKIRITADTYLLIDDNAPEKVLKYNPSMKFILILREPVSRAFSGYNYSVRNGYINENVSFIDACKNEKEFENSDDIVQKNNKCNILRSKYHQNLKKWQKYFDKDAFLLLKTSDLKENPQKLIQQIEKFLQIESSDIFIDEKEKNKAFSVKSKFLQQLLVNRNNPIRKTLKKIMPSFVNKILIKSGIVVRIANMNKQTAKYSKITEEEYEFAYNLLKEDMESLKLDYNIDFSK